jgi:hypothetical protein
LEANFVPAGFEVLVPKVVELLRQSSERFLPAALALIYGSPTISAQLIGKAPDLDLGQSIIGGAFDNVMPLI